MSKHLTMSFISTVFAGLCSIALSAQNLAPDISGKAWRMSTKNSEARFEQGKNVPEDEKASAMLNVAALSTNDIGIYAYVPMNENKSYSVKFEFKVKDFKKASDGFTDLKLNFNKKNGGNGSAGSLKISLNIDVGQSGWQNFSAEVQAPPETEKAQMILSFRQITGTVLFRNISVEEVKDNFVIRKAETAPVIDGKLDDACWKDSMPLAPFYYSDDKARPAKVSTTAFMTYDDKNLYVAFINDEADMDKLRENVKEREGHVWNDDCDEVFISTSETAVYQFVLNSINTQWDGTLSSKVPGDPYKADGQWNGEWKSAVSKNKKSWITEIAIPFTNLQTSPKEGSIWHINLARERKANSELSHFNRVADVFNNVAKFSPLEFAKNSAKLERFTETEQANPLAVIRKSPKFKELLSDKAGNYIPATWGAECVMDYLSENMKAKYTPETFSREQDAILEEFGKAGMLGPVSLPWAEKYIGMKRIKEYYEKYGTKYWLMANNSSFSKKAVKEGAVYYTELFHGTDSCDPAFQKVMEDFIKEYFTANRDKLPYISFILGRDEPTNCTMKAYSMTMNKKNKDALLKLDAKIKAEFGAGKYGLYDASATNNDPAVAPFSIIAFMKWWNGVFGENTFKQKELLKEYAPGISFMSHNMNCCSGLGNEDISQLAAGTDWVSADPYPTSSMYYFGRGRAMYHSGFSVKLAKDLSGSKNVCSMLQGFPYCGRNPSADNMREWASQALKNGSGMILWYASGGNGSAKMLRPESYREMLRISKLVRELNKLQIPSETKTAIFFSNTSHWGNFDKAVHPWYTVYSILGEQLKTWFRFVSDSGLKLKMDKLSKYKAVYVPQLKYCDPDIAEALLNYVKGGGKLIVFDPEAFTWNTDGTHLDKIRNELLGCGLGKAIDVKNIIASADFCGLKKGDELPLTPLSHRSGAGKIQAFEITPPAGAKVIANYPDGKPAAFERTVGKGSVIYFAAQPFGNSDLAVKDSKWSVFMKGIAEQIGEKTDLPIWDFELPAKGGEIEVKYVVKPEVK